MKVIYLVVVVVLTFCSFGCSDKKAEVDVTKSSLSVHKGDNALDAGAKDYSGIIANKTLPDFPDKSVGKALEDYKFIERRDWKSTTTANGSVYVDFNGWYPRKGLDVDAIKKGIVLEGINIKFKIDQNGNLYISMVARLEAMANGSVVSTPLADIKSVLSMIYAGKELAMHN